MPRTVPIAIGAGILSAFIFALVLTGSPIAIIVSPFTMLPLLLVGLSSNFAISGLATISGILAIGLFGVIGGSLSWAGVYAATEAVPALGISRLALRKRPDAGGTPRHLNTGTIFTVAVVYVAALFVLLFLALADREGGLLGTIHEAMVNILTMLRPEASPEQIFADALSAAMMFPGLTSAWWLIILLANLAISQALLLRWNRMQRPPLGLAAMKLPRWLVAILGLSLVLAVLGGTEAGFVGITLAIIFAVPFFFVGMVCVHLLCRNWPPGPFVLIATYLAMIILHLPALAPTVLGIADQWIKLRDRIGGAHPV